MPVILGHDYSNINGEADRDDQYTDKQCSEKSCKLQ